MCIIGFGYLLAMDQAGKNRKNENRSLTMQVKIFKSLILFFHWFNYIEKVTYTTYKV